MRTQKHFIFILSLLLLAGCFDSPPKPMKLSIGLDAPQSHFSPLLSSPLLLSRASYPTCGFAIASGHKTPNKLEEIEYFQQQNPLLIVDYSCLGMHGVSSGATTLEASSNTNFTIKDVPTGGSQTIKIFGVNLNAGFSCFGDDDRRFVRLIKLGAVSTVKLLGSASVEAVKKPTESVVISNDFSNALPDIYAGCISPPGAPTLESVSPTTGSTAGGTVITLTGTGFLSGATVTVGGSACTPLTVVSSTSITCTTPSGTAGAKDIVVTVSSQSDTLSGGFTYATGASNASLSVSGADPYNYGSATVATNTDNTFTITNSGGSTATALTNSGFTTGTEYSYPGGFAGGGTCVVSGNVAAGATCTVIVRFTPTTTGVKNDTFTIGYHNGTANTSTSKDVTGTGTAAASNPSGMMDTSFSSDGKWASNITGGAETMHAIAAYQNDNVLVGGSNGGTGKVLLARVSSSGILDTTFNTSGYFSAAINALNTRSIWDIAIQTDGKILFTESDSNSGGSAFGQVIRMLSNSALDTTFKTVGFASVSYGPGTMRHCYLAIQTDAKIVVGGQPGAAHDATVYRYETNGMLDTSFATLGYKTYDGPGGIAGESGRIRVNTDGTIAHSSWHTSGPSDKVLVGKFLSNGALDTSFNTWGTYFKSGESGGYSLGFDTSGLIVVFGTDSVYRFKPTGSGFDTSFHTDGAAAHPGAGSGILSDGLVHSNGKPLALGNSSASANNPAAYRYNLDGTLDTSFNTTGERAVTYNTAETAAAIIARPGGSICMASYRNAGGNQSQISCFTP